MNTTRTTHWARQILTRFPLRALPVALAAGMLAACSPVGQTTGSGHAHWLRLSLGQGDPNTLNIHLEPSATTGYIAELTQAYLARYDDHAQPVPELATVIPTKANRGICATACAGPMARRSAPTT